MLIFYYIRIMLWVCYCIIWYRFDFLHACKGHSSIDVSLRQTCTHGLVANHWATLWSSSTAEVLDPSTETGYGALACGMLHHMVVDPQSNLQEISMKLDEHVAASTGDSFWFSVGLSMSLVFWNWCCVPGTQFLHRISGAQPCTLSVPRDSWFTGDHNLLEALEAR